MATTRWGDRKTWASSSRYWGASTDAQVLATSLTDTIEITESIVGSGSVIGFLRGGLAVLRKAAGGLVERNR